MLDSRRPVRARHRAPREPAHRQPAARPLRPSGRPRPVALLPQPRRRPAAHLRPADDVRAADEQEPRGWRGDRQPVDLEGDRDRAEEGRGAQLRHPQAGRRIRRRDERPAQGHLRAALRHHGCRGRQRRRRRHARGNGCLARHRALPARHLSGAVGRRGPEGERRRDLRPAAADRRLAARKKRSSRKSSSSGCRSSPTKRWRRRSPRSIPSAGTRSRRTSFSRRSTISGRSIWRRSMRCAPVIHLRSYAQKKPIDEYKQEAFLLFERLLISIREEVTRVLMRAQVQFEAPPPLELPDFITQHIDPLSGEDDTADVDRRAGAFLSSLGISSLNIPTPDLPADENGDVAEPADQPQRAMPVRFGQEVQALPRAAGLTAERRRLAQVDRTQLRRAYRADEETVVRERLAAGPAGSGEPGRGDRDCPRAGEGRSGAQAVRPRRLPSRLRPRQRRGHCDDVPRRGAAAHSRRAYRRRADRRQIVRARLGGEAGPVRLVLRQRRDLLAAADRQGAGRRERPQRQLARRARPRGRAAWRAGGPHRGPRGDEDPRPQLRLRPDDRRSAAPRQARARARA